MESIAPQTLDDDSAKVVANLIGTPLVQAADHAAKAIHREGFCALELGGLGDQTLYGCTFVRGDEVMAFPGVEGNGFYGKRTSDNDIIVGIFEGGQQASFRWCPDTGPHHDGYIHGLMSRSTDGWVSSAHVVAVVTELLNQLGACLKIEAELEAAGEPSPI